MHFYRNIKHILFSIGFLLPGFLMGQNERQLKNVGNVVGLNFECSISECNFTLSGNFLEDLSTLKNDNSELYSSLGSDIQGGTISSPLIGHPIAYTSGNTLQISLNFGGNCEALSSPILVRGVSPSGYQFPPLSLTVNTAASGVSSFTYEGEASSPFVAGVVDFIDLEINWQMKIGSQEWEDIVTTKNKIYVTLKTPISEGMSSSGVINPWYFHLESCFYVGCIAAKGSTTEESVVEKVWSAFETQDLVNSNGQPLKYYDNNNSNSWIQAEDNTYVDKLLADLNGQCTAWCRFFLEVLKSMGLEQSLEIATIDQFGPDPSLPIWGDGFFVNEWTFLQASSIFDDNPIAAPFINLGYEYILVPHSGASPPPINASNTYNFTYEELTDEVGVSGQNSTNPQSIFNFHQVGKVGDHYYDASYGGSSFGETNFLINYQNQNISGYYKILKIENVVEADLGTGGVDLNGDGNISDVGKTYLIYFVKKQDNTSNDAILEISLSSW